MQLVPHTYVYLIFFFILLVFFLFLHLLDLKRHLDSKEEMYTPAKN